MSQRDAGLHFKSLRDLKDRAEFRGVFRSEKAACNEAGSEPEIRCGKKHIFNDRAGVKRSHSAGFRGNHDEGGSAVKRVVAL